MSEIKVDKISPETGTAFTIGDSGDTFTVPSGVTIVNSGTATGFGGGKILQCVGMTKTDTIDFTTTSWTDLTGMTQTITPTAASSKILVMASLQTSGDDNGSAGRIVANVDGGSFAAISIGDASGSRQRCSFDLRGSSGGWVNSMLTKSVTFLHTPSYTLTDALIYRVQYIRSYAGESNLNKTKDDTDNANYTNAASSITLMEVGA